MSFEAQLMSLVGHGCLFCAGRATTPIQGWSPLWGITVSSPKVTPGACRSQAGHHRRLFRNLCVDGKHPFCSELPWDEALKRWVRKPGAEQQQICNSKMDFPGLSLGSHVLRTTAPPGSGPH